mmetsp:Transcript_40927/g.65770  ORF Transcript_40927/g.65770 Transcript_40927/m.65770 type:complete len:102 (-) Transcript_40927:384-689(-)
MAVCLHPMPYGKNTESTTVEYRLLSVLYCYCDTTYQCFFRTVLAMLALCLHTLEKWIRDIRETFRPGSGMVVFLKYRSETVPEPHQTDSLVIKWWVMGAHM